MSEYILVHLTTSSEVEAKKIIRFLLDKKLIACATIIPNVTSLYLWKGEIEEETEVEVQLKTKDILFDKVRSLIEKHHSYQTPQILKIPISSANKAYLKWIDDSLLVGL